MAFLCQMVGGVETKMCSSFSNKGKLLLAEGHSHSQRVQLSLVTALFLISFCNFVVLRCLRFGKLACDRSSMSEGSKNRSAPPIFQTLLNDSLLR